MKNIFSRSNKFKTITFGEDEKKTVKIRKITVGQWKEVFDEVNALPQILLGLFLTPPDKQANFLMGAIKESTIELVRITSILTGIDEKWLTENASMDELFYYFSETAKHNNFSEIAKNVQSVLGLNDWIVLPKKAIQNAEKE